MARDRHLDIVAWHTEKSAAVAVEVADLPGAVAAVADCLRRRAPLWVVSAGTLAGYDQLRDVAAFLDQHGLCVVRGVDLFTWAAPRDEVDAAVRAALSRHGRLRCAVAAADARGIVDELLGALDAGGNGDPAPTIDELRAEQDAARAGMLASGRLNVGDVQRSMVAALQVVRGCRAPRLLPPDSASAPRLAACAALARWLYQAAGYWTQEVVADYLNGCGQRTRRGRLWTQASVCHLLRSGLEQAA